MNIIYNNNGKNCIVVISHAFSEIFLDMDIFLNLLIFNLKIGICLNMLWDIYVGKTVSYCLFRSLVVSNQI